MRLSVKIQHPRTPGSNGGVQLRVFQWSGLFLQGSEEVVRHCCKVVKSYMCLRIRSLKTIGSHNVLLPFSRQVTYVRGLIAPLIITGEPPSKPPVFGEEASRTSLRARSVRSTSTSAPKLRGFSVPALVFRVLLYSINCVFQNAYYMLDTQTIYNKNKSHKNRRI